MLESGSFFEGGAPWLGFKPHRATDFIRTHETSENVFHFSNMFSKPSELTFFLIFFFLKDESVQL